MILPEHITNGFDFTEAIALADLCQRATQTFAQQHADPAARYAALFADEWEFAHAICAPAKAAYVLILRRGQHNQWAVVLQPRAPSGPTADAKTRSPGNDEENDEAGAIPITNLMPEDPGHEEEAADRAFFKEQFRSAPYPPLPGELAPPPLGARVGWSWLAALDGCKDEIERFFSAVVGASKRQSYADAPTELEIYLTGHGDGGCLAALCALYLKRTWESQIDFPYFGLKMVNFGSPKIGNHAFAGYYNQQMKGFSYCVQNLLDGVIYEPTLKAPFPYNLELLLPGIDYVRNGDQYYMAYEHIGEALILAGVGSAKQGFNFRGPFPSMMLAPFAHRPEGYKQMLVEAQKLQATYWKPFMQVAEKVDARRKELVSAFQQQAKRVADHQRERSQRNRQAERL